MKKIIISVSNDLTTDQRIEKVCESLHKNGYDITLIGIKLPNSLALHRNYNTKRLQLFFNKGFLFYTELNIRLFFLLFFSKKDILLANDMDTLLPNFVVSKIQRKKLVFDSHELFSEIPELVHKPNVKQFWVYLEKLLIPKLKNCYTVCDSIAIHFKNLYQTDFKVIRNLPKEKQNLVKTSIFPKDKKIILYQGAVNLGRGLELMLKTIHFLDDFIFVIVGDGDILENLQESVLNLNKKVLFLGRLTPLELQKITPNVNIGISFEEDLGLNYRYALPNKIFDYINAEIPILISDLPEMKQIVLNYNVGEIILDRNPEKLAKQIKNLSKKDFSSELKLAKDKLNWKQDEKKLLSVFKNLM